MKLKWCGALALLGLLLAESRVVAHHSFQAQFDEKKLFQLTGVLAKVEWSNPHTYFYLDVKNNRGQVERWALESFGPAQFRRTGLSRAGLFQPGQTYTVTVAGAKDGSKLLAWVKDFKFPDGKVITIWWGDPRDVN